MSELKQAVERLAMCCLVESRASHADLRAVLSALSRAEAERDLLAAECRAWRDWEPEGDMGPLMEPRNVERARAATDAAGVLKEGSR